MTLIIRCASYRCYRTYILYTVTLYPGGTKNNEERFLTPLGEETSVGIIFE